MPELTVRRVRIRRPGMCCACRSQLEVGDTACWNADARSLTCLPCLVHPRTDDPRGDHPRTTAAATTGASAGRSYRIGARGEELVGALLDGMAKEGHLHVLHDRRRPPTRANIDHVAVTAGGVWVVDAKRCTGRVKLARRDTRRGPCLVVSGRPRPGLIAGLGQQVAAVRSALAAVGHIDLPVHGALCFVDTDLSLFQRELRIADHLVTWPKRLARHLREEGSLDRSAREGVVRALAHALPPAT